MFLVVLKNFSAAQDLSKVWSTLYSDTTTYIMYINYHVVDAKGNSYVAGYKQYYFEFYRGNYQATNFLLLKVNSKIVEQIGKFFYTECLMPI